MDARTRLSLRDDVMIRPLNEVPESIRERLDGAPDDFVISQSRGRNASMLVDARFAELIQSFKRPLTFAEAVIEFSRPRELDPEEVLEAAWPIVSRLTHRGILVDETDEEARAASRQSFQPGNRVEDLTIVRCLQVLDDGELYQVLHEHGFAAFKFARHPAALDHEAEILAHLEGDVAPEFLRRADVDAGPYLLMEWCHGVDVGEAAVEWRERRGAEARLLNLCRAVARAYARLHELDVIQGDVHPRNVLIDRGGRARLIDFALARRTSSPSWDAERGRPGVPFYFEPELARSILAGRGPLAPSPAGEQFAVAALIYYLLTGTHYSNFSLEQSQLYPHIAQARPVAFVERGLEPRPRLEAILKRALSQDPADRFPSMRAFADALGGLPDRRANPLPAPHAPIRAPQDLLANAELEGPWLEEGLGRPPTASVSYGAAGLALALYRIACQRDDPHKLALADVWCRHAQREAEGPDGLRPDPAYFGTEPVELVSAFHSAAGISAVAARVAWARADAYSLHEAVHSYLTFADNTTGGFDLIQGRAGLLLGCALLLDLMTDPEPRLVELGQRLFDELRSHLAGKSPADGTAYADLGIAHGWAGGLYASLQWCRAAGRQLPPDLERQLDTLAALAVPVGRGFEWRGVGHGSGEGLSASWCRGSAGHVFLWTLAAHTLGNAPRGDDPAFEDLAIGAGWHAWESPELAANLCCGLAGRAYAMLRLYKHTGERLWLDRARDLASRASREGRFEDEYPHSLYKGEVVLSVLKADLERPGEAVMPFFEETSIPAA